MAVCAVGFGSTCVQKNYNSSLTVRCVVEQWHTYRQSPW